MTQTFDSEVSLHSWLLWPTVCHGTPGDDTPEVKNICIIFEIMLTRNYIRNQAKSVVKLCCAIYGRFCEEMMKSPLTIVTLWTA